MARKILIASGKGGTGKTVIAASLAESLSDRGERVLVIEGQTGLRSLDLQFGAEHEMLSHFGNVLKGRESLSEASWAKNERLSFLPSPQTAKYGTYSASDFERIIAAGEELFDYIIVDAPSGIGPDVVAAAGGCEEVILCITPCNADVRAADRCLQALHRIPPLKAYLVINRIKDTEMDELLDFADLLPADILALIAEDDLCTDKMADRLRGVDRPLDYPVKKGLKSRFKNLFGNSK